MKVSLPPIDMKNLISRKELLLPAILADHHLLTWQTQAFYRCLRYGMNSPDFSHDFYCGAAIPRIDCVALGLDAQVLHERLRVQTVTHLATTWYCGSSLRNL